VALASTSLIDITLMKSTIPEKSAFLFFNFAGAIVAYNFVKYSGISKLYHKKMAKSMKAIQILTLVFLFFFFYYVFKLPLRPILYLIPFSILTVLYAVPALPKKNNLRNLAGVKIFIIALVWTGVTIIVPSIYAGVTANLDFVVASIQRFLFIFVIMLPFEIRDLRFDDLSLETIPQTLGITKTKVFGSILLLVFLLLTFIKSVWFTAEILSITLVSTISLLFLWGTEKEQTKYYCSFGVESIPILWWVFLTVFQKLFA